MRVMLLAILLVPLAACGDGERVPVGTTAPVPGQAQRATPAFEPAPVANRTARVPDTGSNIQFQGYGAKK